MRWILAAGMWASRGRRKLQIPRFKLQRKSKIRTPNRKQISKLLEIMSRKKFDYLFCRRDAKSDADIDYLGNSRTAAWLFSDAEAGVSEDIGRGVGRFSRIWRGDTEVDDCFCG